MGRFGDSARYSSNGCVICRPITRIDESGTAKYKRCGRTHPITLSWLVRMYCNLRVRSWPDFACIASNSVWYSVMRLKKWRSIN